MALVYFDTSNIDLLSKLRRRNPDRYASFLAKWRELNCTLALSGVHIFELRRYGDSSGREGRYQLLEELCPIRCQRSLIDNLEILRALNHHRDELGLEDLTEKIDQPFPMRFNTAVELSEIRMLEDDGLNTILEGFYEASKVGAAASSRSPGSKYERRRVSQLSDAKPDPEHRAAFLKDWGKQQPPPSELENFHKLVPPEVMNEVFNVFRDLGLRFLDRAEEVGSAQAFGEALGVDLDNKAISSSYIDQVAQQYAFRFSVRGAAQTVGLQNETELEIACQVVQLADCPGMWLRNAVEIQIKKAVAKDEPSNLFDLSHLSHLPYVDLLFTDKRIAEFSRQVLKSSTVPTSLRGVNEPLAVSNSIDALESAIESNVC